MSDPRLPATAGSAASRLHDSAAFWRGIVIGMLMIVLFKLAWRALAPAPLWYAPAWFWF
jgi:hypothetical protein